MIRITQALNNISVSSEADSAADAFDDLAIASEWLPAEACGNCEERTFRLSRREHDGNVFREVVCLGCGAKLGISQRQSDGVLYAKRKRKDAGGMLVDLENRGWVVWKKKAANDDWGA